MHQSQQVIFKNTQEVMSPKPIDLTSIKTFLFKMQKKLVHMCQYFCCKLSSAYFKI